MSDQAVEALVIFGGALACTLPFFALLFVGSRR